jgi:Na+/H+ antiporter NhaD/arsenite permease-like protein
MLDYALIFISLLALLSIVFEEITHVNKAKTTLFFGCISWILLFITAEPAQHELLNYSLEENLLEIAVLWLFLMSTMTFVAYLNSKGIIQMAVQKLFPAKSSVTTIMFLVAIFSLFLSAICDNITATLVSLTLLQSFNIDSKTKLRMAVLVVFSVNSGGVALITGDVTTLMIYLDGHLRISQLFLLLLPALVSVLFLAAIFSIGLKGQVTTTPARKDYETVDVLIAIIFFSTILCTMLFNVIFSIPPVLTFLTGLSIMFLVGQMFRSDKQERRMLEYVRQIEFDTLLFFLGILLLVGMLKEIGVLQVVTQVYTEFAPMYSNYVAGIASALLDNVPLTAALLKAEPILNSAQWLGLTYAVGVGGSLLVIGSAAGIIAMSKVKEMTFMSYCRYIPVLLIAYTLGYALTIVLANYLYL